MYHFLTNLEHIIKPTHEELVNLRAALTPRTIKKNEYFLKEGDVCNRIGFVEKGSFRSFFTTSKKEICKGFFFENDLIGSLASFLSRSPSLMNIAAVEQSLVLEITHEQLFQLIDASPSWKKFADIIIEDQLIRNEKREASLMKDPPDSRFRKLMEEHPKIFKRIALQDIASYLAITPETLSRYRKKMMEDKSC